MADIIIGKIKGKPDVFGATIETNNINDLNHHQRVKTTDLLNLTYLEFLLCTKASSSNEEININKLIKLNTESYIDWAVIELLTDKVLTLEGTLKTKTQVALPQGTQATLSQATQVALPQGTQATLSQGTQVTLSQGTQATLSQATQATLSQATQATLPPGTQATLPPGTQVTLPQGTQVTPAISSIIELTFKIDGKTIKVNKKGDKWKCEANEEALDALRELIDFWK